MAYNDFCLLSTKENLTVFRDLCRYRMSSYGSGWKKDVTNRCLESGGGGIEHRPCQCCTLLGLWGCNYNGAHSAVFDWDLLGFWGCNYNCAHSAVFDWDSGDVIIMVRTVLYLTGTYWDSGDVIIMVHTLLYLTGTYWDSGDVIIMVRTVLYSTGTLGM